MADSSKGGANAKSPELPGLQLVFGASRSLAQAWKHLMRLCHSDEATALLWALGTIFASQIIYLFWIWIWSYFTITWRSTETDYSAEYTWGWQELNLCPENPVILLFDLFLLPYWFGFQRLQYKVAAWTCFYFISLGLGGKIRETRKWLWDGVVIGNVDHLRVHEILIV